MDLQQTLRADDTVAGYLAAWAGPDAARRAGLVEAVRAPDATYTDPRRAAPEGPAWPK